MSSPLHAIRKTFRIFATDFMQGESGESPGCPATVSDTPWRKSECPARKQTRNRFHDEDKRGKLNTL